MQCAIPLWFVSISATHTLSYSLIMQVTDHEKEKSSSITYLLVKPIFHLFHERFWRLTEEFIMDVDIAFIYPPVCLKQEKKPH